MTVANAGSLADLQAAFQDYVLAGNPAFAGSVRDTRKAKRQILLDVYRDGYALRLIEVLENDYPGLVAMAGPQDFDYMARAYIAAHPSPFRSVRWYGGKLAEFLASTPPFDKSPDAIEMARFEWALGDAFDAPNATPITAKALMALAPEAWETLSFTALPSLKRLELAFEVPQAWQRRDEQEPGNLEVEPAAGPTPWVIWRPEFVSSFRSLERDEAPMLDALLAGRPFPEMCESLIAALRDEGVGEEQAAARAASRLRGWIEEGMIASFKH
jgi:hypothetical protein